MNGWVNEGLDGGFDNIFGFMDCWLLTVSCDGFTEGFLIDACWFSVTVILVGWLRCNKIKMSSWCCNDKIIGWDVSCLRIYCFVSYRG